MPAYEHLHVDTTRRKVTMVSFDMGPSKTTQSKREERVIVNAKNSGEDEGRIPRPRTAELAPHLRARLDQFRELDDIVFFPPVGLGTPSATPIFGISADRRGMASASYLIAPFAANFVRHDLMSQMPPEAHDIAMRIINESSIKHLILNGPQKTLNSTQTKKHKRRRTFNDSLTGNSHRNAAENEKNAALVRLNVDNELRTLHTPKEVVQRRDSYLIVRDVLQRYQMPKFTASKRLTPKPTLSNISALNTAEYPADAAAKSAEPAKFPSPDAIDGDEALLQINPANSFQKPSISHLATINPKKHIGNVFPIDFFMDQERLDILLGYLKANPDGVECRARYWNLPKGLNYLTVECLVESTEDPSLWKDCTIVEFQKKHNCFLVRWHHDYNLPIDRKVISEILLPSESTKTLRYHLNQAVLLREEYEYYLALNECVNIVKSKLEHILPFFDHSVIERLFQVSKDFVNSLHGDTKKPLADKNPSKPKEEEEDSVHELLIEEIAEIRLIEMQAELKSSFYDSEVTSFLTSNRFFRSLVSGSHMDPFKMTFIPLPEPSSVTNLLDTHQRSVERISITIEPQLDVFLSRDVHFAIYEMHQAITAIFEKPIIDVMKTHVARVHASKKRLVVPELLSKKSSAVPEEHLEAGVNSRKKNHKRVQQLHPQKPQKLAAPTVITEVKTVEIHPIIDDDGNVSFTAGDFLDMILWLQHDFDVSFRELFPSQVHRIFKSVLSSYGLSEPDAPVQSHLTLYQRSTRVSQTTNPNARNLNKSVLSPQELYLKLGKSISAMAATYAGPIARNRIMETYKLVQNGQLHIQITANFKNDSMDDSGYSFDYGMSLSDFRDNLKTRLVAWTNPVPAFLPTGIFNSDPVDHRYIEILFKDLVEDSTETALEYLKWLHDSLVPKAHDGSTKPVMGKDEHRTAEFLNSVQKSLSSIQSIEKFVAHNNPKCIRGIFQIDNSEMNKQLRIWASNTLQALKSSCNETVTSISNELIDKCSSFFKQAPPTTFEETKIATEALNVMMNTGNWVQNQISALVTLKQFMDDHKWIQSDSDYNKTIRARLIHDEFFEFVAIRERQIHEANATLATNISREVEIFMADWSVIQGTIDRTFVKQVPVHRVSLDAGMMTDLPVAAVEMINTKRRHHSRSFRKSGAGQGSGRSSKRESVAGSGDSINRNSNTVSMSSLGDAESQNSLSNTSSMISLSERESKQILDDSLSLPSLNMKAKSSSVLIGSESQSQTLDTERKAERR